MFILTTEDGKTMASTDLKFVTIQLHRARCFYLPLRHYDTKFHKMILLIPSLMSTTLKLIRNPSRLFNSFKWLST